jgi:hypothetical protein
VIAIVAGMVGSLFASDAWNDFTCAAGETANPKIILQFNLFFNTLIVNLFYIFLTPHTCSFFLSKKIQTVQLFHQCDSSFATEDRVDNLAACMFLKEVKRLFI